MGKWLDFFIIFLIENKCFSVDYGIQRNNFYNSFSVGTDYVKYKLISLMLFVGLYSYLQNYLSLFGRGQGAIAK